MSDFQRDFIRIFKEKIPKDINAVNLLTEMISIKKEGAYLRLKGVQPFTFDEIAKIAMSLKISLDSILDNKVRNTYQIGFVRLDSVDPFYEYSKVVIRMIDNLQNVKLHPSPHLYMATNRIPITHLLRYPTLSKLRFFKHFYQYRKSSAFQKMSEIVVPNYVRELELKLTDEIQQVKIDCLWTKDIFNPYVADILYFSEIGLLSKEEVYILKEELQSLLDTLAQTVLSGEMESGLSFKTYVLNTFLDASCAYMEAGPIQSCTVNLFGINFHSSSESVLCDNMKEWINSLLKYSVLISQSGAVDRAAFFKYQQNLLNTIHV